VNVPIDAATSTTTMKMPSTGAMFDSVPASAPPSPIAPDRSCPCSLMPASRVVRPAVSPIVIVIVNGRVYTTTTTLTTYDRRRDQQANPAPAQQPHPEAIVAAAFTVTERSGSAGLTFGAIGAELGAHRRRCTGTSGTRTS